LAINLKWDIKNWDESGAKVVQVVCVLRTGSNQFSLLSNCCYFVEFPTPMVDFVPPPPVLLSKLRLW